MCDCCHVTAQPTVVLISPSFLLFFSSHTNNHRCVAKLTAATEAARQRAQEKNLDIDEQNITEAILEAAQVGLSFFFLSSLPSSRFLLHSSSFSPSSVSLVLPFYSPLSSLSPSSSSLTLSLFSFSSSGNCKEHSNFGECGHWCTARVPKARQTTRDKIGVQEVCGRKRADERIEERREER